MPLAEGSTSAFGTIREILRSAQDDTLATSYLMNILQMRGELFAALAGTKPSHCPLPRKRT